MLEESTTYQGIFRKGKEMGRVEGAIRALRRVLHLQGRKRFGAPSKAVKKRIQAISDIHHLERLGERLLEVASWQELLAKE